MYNVKGPSKFVAKTRRGLPQNMDNMREYARNRSAESDDNELTGVPKPVFHNKKSAPHHHRQEVISPQHEEIIKFISDSWNKVCAELCQNSDTSLSSKSDQSKYYEDEHENSKKLKDHVREMEDTIKSLEENLKDSNRASNQVMMALQSDKIKRQGISNQLEEALKENQHLLDILQQKATEQDISRTNSQGDVSRTCSTMSIVHLQYKYDELLANHRGLLKLLDMKYDEIKKVHEENVQARTEVGQLRRSLLESADKCAKLQAKLLKLKERKDGKINKLKVHRETLQIAHNQLANVLHSHCMERDADVADEIRNCEDSERALLLQEIRKNNVLAYENFQLNQQVEFLKSLLRAEKRQHRRT